MYTRTSSEIKKELARTLSKDRVATRPARSLDYLTDRRVHTIVHQHNCRVAWLRRPSE